MTAPASKPAISSCGMGLVLRGKVGDKPSCDLSDRAARSRLGAQDPWELQCIASRYVLGYQRHVGECGGQESWNLGPCADSVDHEGEARVESVLPRGVRPRNSGPGGYLLAIRTRLALRP